VIVTISGRPGSGKSVVASKVARELNLSHLSAGDFMREMAAERGVSILELSRVAEQGDEIDREIDARTVRLAEQGGDFVMDARLGWHFIPDSIKVFLEVDPLVAAQRIFEARRQSEVENVTLEETQRAVQDRTESERRRYLDYYGVDYGDHANYDLVIDTSELPIDQVVENVVAYVRSL
jgi:predicted cytidylate kinase